MIMASPILNIGATIACAHGGTGSAAVASSRVHIAGLPIATIATLYKIASCPFGPPSGNGPCVSGKWSRERARVMSEGNSVAILDGTGICVPTGSPLLALAAQRRVTVI